MPEPITVTFEVSIEIFQSHPHEWDDALAELEAERWRQALFAAHRAWTLFGEWALYLLGESVEDRRAMQLAKITTGLDGPEARRRYIASSGDRSLAGDSRRWERLTTSIRLRGEAEHHGRPVSADAARDAIAVRRELMAHVNAVLRQTSGVDSALVDRGEVR